MILVEMKFEHKSFVFKHNPVALGFNPLHALLANGHIVSLKVTLNKVCTENCDRADNIVDIIYYHFIIVKSRSIKHY